MPKKSTEKKDVLSKLKGWFKSLKSEVRKIFWPTKEAVLKQSAAVVIISVILSAFIRLIDVVSQLLIKAVGSIF